VRQTSLLNPVRRLGNPRGTAATIGLLAALALPAAAAADTSVSISDSGYAPATVTIKQGEVVTWTNKGTRRHTVTSDTGTTMASDPLGPGDSFATIFVKPGTFRYHSTVEPDQMQGTVVVKAAPLPTATGPTPPTGTVPEGFKPGPGITTPETTAANGGTSDGWLVAGIVAVCAALAGGLAAWWLRRRRRLDRSGA
jgi:plastocyanin